jgi:hypothetical protein
MIRESGNPGVVPETTTGLTTETGAQSQAQDRRHPHQQFTRKHEDYERRSFIRTYTPHIEHHLE